MRLGDLTSAEVGERLAVAPLVLVVPLGSCEQHGPHLPLNTDSRVAGALAAGLADRRPDVIVAPAVSVGASGEHQGFPGTLSIGSDALEHMAVELARSADLFRGVVFVSGHGGNATALQRAVDRLEREDRRALAWWPRFEGPRNDAHAGFVETSLMLAIAPDLVHAERARKGETAPLAELWPRLVESGVVAVSPSGVLGDPTGATAEAGRAMLGRLTSDLERAVVNWESQRATADKIAGTAPR